MCTVVFIAANNPLPLIEWDENAPSFYVSQITQAEDWVQEHLTKPFIYSLGSYTGCACGFDYGLKGFKNDEDKECDLKARESVRRLAKYLSEALQHGSVEMFANDGSEWDFELMERVTVTPSYFGGDSFNFEGMKFFIIEHES